MAVILDHADLTDTWVVTHPNVDPSLVTSPLEAVQKLGITADSPLNSFSAAKGYTHGSWGKRLDYVLYRQPIRNTNQPLPVLRAVASKVVFMDLVPGQMYSYSDHFGLDATLEVVQPDASAPVAPVPPRILTNASIATTIQALTSCYRFSKERSRKELVIFALSILVLIGVVVSSAWLPHSWINPIYLLFTIFMTWLATTMLYEGFIFGNWECNALMNVIEELEIHRKGQELISGQTQD